jgi:biopolymer transport protein ExbB
MREIYEFLFVKGGPVMYTLVFALVIALAVLLERLWYLQRSRLIPPGLLPLVRRLVREGKFSEATAVCEQNTSSIAYILGAGLRNQGRPRQVIKDAIEEAGRYEAANLDRYMTVLSTLAGLATLLGLLGTVTGMISVFQRASEAVGMEMDERTRLLSGGIWEALINTAAGLTVAVFAIVSHAYLVSRINSVVLEMESQAMQLLDLIDVSSGAEAEPRVAASAVPASGAAPPAPVSST